MDYPAAPTLEFGCVALATAAEIALKTPNPDSNVDCVYYSIKADFQMEPYMGTLHQGPLCTTLACFRLGQHWLHTLLGRYGPNRVPYENRWCQHCASMQHMMVDLEEHAIFECPLYAREVGVECCAAQSLDASPIQLKAARRTTQGSTIKSQEPRPAPPITERDASTQQPTSTGQGEGINHLHPRMTGQRLEEGSKLQECCGQGFKSPRLSKRGQPCMRDIESATDRL